MVCTDIKVAFGSPIMLDSGLVIENLFVNLSAYLLAPQNLVVVNKLIEIGY